VKGNKTTGATIADTPSTTARSIAKDVGSNVLLAKQTCETKSHFPFY